MQNLHLSLLALLAGMAISTQSAISGQLSQKTGSPLIASAAIYLVGLIAIIVYLSINNGQLPTRASISKISPTLWISGGLISTLALSTVYWVMPTLGTSTTLVCVICGQLIIGAIISQFGWFELPIVHLSLNRLIALALVFSGAILYNYQPNQ